MQSVTKPWQREAFRASPQEIRRLLAGRPVVDSRNLLDPEQAAATGLVYLVRNSTAAQFG